MKPIITCAGVELDNFKFLDTQVNLGTCQTFASSTRSAAVWMKRGSFWCLLRLKLLVLLPSANVQSLHAIEEDDLKSLKEALTVVAEVTDKLKGILVRIYRQTKEGILVRFDKVGPTNSEYPLKIDPITNYSEELHAKIAEAWNAEEHIEIIPAEANPEYKNGCIVIIPILTNSDEAPGLLILGMNPNLEYDEAYENFVLMAVHEIATSYTNIKSLETAKKQNQALIELDKVKTSFFMSMSHELRTPLTLIIGPIEDVIKESKKQLTAEQSSTLELVRKNACRLLKLVNSLLDVGRLNAGCMTATYRKANITDKITQFVNMFESIVKKAKLEFLCDIARIEAPCYVDEEILQKIVFNLLGNAIKFTLKGFIKCILKLCDDKKSIEFTVQDSGIGIPADQLKKVFQQFSRVEYAGGRSYEGSGIGLALVNDLVKTHNGSIKVESEIGKGTSFIVSIPLGKDHLPQDRVVETSYFEESTPMSLGNTRHLSAYLEEAQEFAENSAQTITKDQINSITTPDSGSIDENDSIQIPKRDSNEQDSDIFNKRLIFIVDDHADMRKMPVMDGIQLVKEMRRQSDLSNIPIILFSGTGNKIDGFESGADDFLEKPINNREMIIKIQMLLEKSAIRANLENDIKKEKAYSAQAMKRYEQMSRISPLGLFLCDKQGDLLFANDRFAQMFGYDGINTLISETKGSMAAVIFHNIDPEDKERVISHWESSFKTQQSVENLEFRIRPDGIRKMSWVQLHTIVDSESDGTLIHIGCMNDISLRKKLEEEKIQALQAEQETQKNRADEAIQSKIESEKFIDMVCHELRNPLNGIQNSNALLVELVTELTALTEPPTEFIKPDAIESIVSRAKEFTDAIEVCARHQQTIADDVLNLSKLKLRGFMILEFSLITVNSMNLISISKSTLFNPKELVGKVLSTFKAEMKVKKTKLSIHVKEEFARVYGKSDFLGDPARITQILINLVANASKFTMKSEKRAITVFISAEQMESNENGLEETNIREGSTDNFTDVEGRANLIISVADTGIGMTEEEKARLFKQFQQASNRTYAEYGGSGLGLFISKRLVDMMNGHDLEMPVLNGKDATIKIRGYEAFTGQSPGVPIIAVTGNARNEQVNDALSCGMNEVLLKPFTRDK
ncbi:UNVERIFIED_CONTAM: hypothetical protein HDU68_001107 [Siphonaria sp. JEL0065]|nr:hypothetical protein HDU68_001107 [Siphonaria sp. JEL0065]